jgi:hypothetical protein
MSEELKEELKTNKLLTDIYKVLVSTQSIISGNKGLGGSGAGMTAATNVTGTASRTNPRSLLSDYAYQLLQQAEIRRGRGINTQNQPSGPGGDLLPI